MAKHEPVGGRIQDHWTACQCRHDHRVRLKLDPMNSSGASKAPCPSCFRGSNDHIRLLIFKAHQIRSGMGFLNLHTKALTRKVPRCTIVYCCRFGIKMPFANQICALTSYMAHLDIPDRQDRFGLPATQKRNSTISSPVRNRLHRWILWKQNMKSTQILLMDKPHVENVLI